MFVLARKLLVGRTVDGLPANRCKGASPRGPGVLKDQPLRIPRRDGGWEGELNISTGRIAGEETAKLGSRDRRIGRDSNDGCLRARIGLVQGGGSSAPSILSSV